MNPSTFQTVVSICSALFSPDYPVEDKMHKAQACEVFYEYCAQDEKTEEAEYKTHMRRGKIAK